MVLENLEGGAIKRIAFLLFSVAAVADIVALSPLHLDTPTKRLLLSFGVKLGPTYRDWKLISVAHEAGNLNDLRAVLGQRRSNQGLPAALRRRDCEPHHLRLVSSSDVFTLTGRIKVGVIWDLSVKKIDGSTCEFTNEVHSSFTPELLDSLAKQGIPREAFQSARRPLSKAHNRQETPPFAKSIERHALRSSSSARVANAA